MAEHHGAPGHFGRASRMIFHRPTHRPPFRLQRNRGCGNVDGRL